MVSILDVKHLTDAQHAHTVSKVQLDFQIVVVNVMQPDCVKKPVVRKSMRAVASMWLLYNRRPFFHFSLSLISFFLFLLSSPSPFYISPSFLTSLSLTLFTSCVTPFICRTYLYCLQSTSLSRSCYACLCVVSPPLYNGSFQSKLEWTGACNNLASPQEHKLFLEK